VSGDSAGGGKSSQSVRACRRFRVRGKVQGVWFRESTRRQAEILDLHGHAVNLEDGTVEVVASGGAAELDKLAAWLKQGPPLARVEQVSEEDIPDSGIQGFTTR
jgi:acylphosphatase